VGGLNWIQVAQDQDEKNMNDSASWRQFIIQMKKMLSYI
jgi:hypothetical protein